MSQIFIGPRFSYEKENGGLNMKENWDVVIVGGGLAGYIAANYLAKYNLSILLVEKEKSTGGRAKTKQMKKQYFNLGPHALYKNGIAAKTLKELSIQPHGKKPTLQGILMEKDSIYTAPFRIKEILSTTYLTWHERKEWVSIMVRLNSIQSTTIHSLTFKQFVEQIVSSPKVQALLYLLARLSTYCHAPETVSAHVIVSHLQMVNGGVLYLDYGWQSLIDELHNQAVLSGVTIRPQCKVRKISSREQGHFDIIVDNQEYLHSKYVIYTANPSDLLTILKLEKYKSFLQSIIPVKGSTLDVALTNLPFPKRLLALGIDNPIYYSVHSKFATLSNDTNTVILHLFKYHQPNEHIDPQTINAELTNTLSKLQPGWKNALIAKRFIPNLVVNQRLPQVGDEKVIRELRNPMHHFYLAGDWLSTSYMLAEAAVESGKKAALQIIDKERMYMNANQSGRL